MKKVILFVLFLTIFSDVNAIVIKTKKGVEPKTNYQKQKIDEVKKVQDQIKQREEEAKKAKEEEEKKAKEEENKTETETK
ncbi:MAG: hypothetical protein Ta2D_11510 [Rickettsiales bacterium]|nr:MAG: hypothetical protein Ta2D_11510 [Rickettsiales bacterium]